MAKAAGGGRVNALKEPIQVRVEQACAAPPEVVYALLEEPASHLIWAGARQGAKTRLLSMDASEGAAGVGSEFSSSGLDPMGRFEDRSVVTEASAPERFEFVTEARLTTKKGSVADWTTVHRYDLVASGGGCRIAYTLRTTRITALPGALRLFDVPVARSLMTKVASSVPKKGVRNLARMAEERVERPEIRS